MDDRDEIKARLAERLHKAREETGMTLEEVSSVVGWNNYQVLLNIEKGSRDVKAGELSKLARIYKKSLEYFLFGPSEREEARVVWRARGGNAEVKAEESRFRQSLWAYIKLERLNEDEKRFERSDVKSEQVNHTWVDEKAKFYAEKLGGRPARTLENVLENIFGVKIFYFHIGKAGSAASTIMDGHAGILINVDDAPWRRNYDLAHELFHLITWGAFPENEIHCGEDADKQAEKIADRFASALLMPAQEVLIEFDKRIKNNKILLLDLVLLACEFDVSTEALLWRLASLKRFNADEVRELLKNERFREIDKRERRGKWGEKLAFSYRFVHLGFRAMVNGHVSRAKLAQFLNVPLPKLSEYLADYGLFEDEDYSVEFNTA
jgi:Zn-dependent peptidase ImmA (M78 family)/transcriptional regulator with XRE-family HTH domain